MEQIEVEGFRVGRRLGDGGAASGGARRTGGEPLKPHQSAACQARSEVARLGKLPVVLFCAGGVATPADAALMMQLGAEGVFVGSGIFKSNDPKRFARAIVDATTHFDEPDVVLEACRSLGVSDAMPGLDLRRLSEAELLASRGN